MPQHGEEFSNTLLVKIGGAPLPADVVPLLVGGYVDDSTNVPDLFVLRFNDVDGTVLTKANIQIGSPVELTVQTTAPGGPDPLLIGEVTALEVEVTQAGTHTIVRGLDKSHRLFRGTRIAAYPNMTASDIVRQVAQRAGLQVNVDATNARLEHVTQDGNDWDFVRRLAAESDRMVTVAAGKLEFVKRPVAGEAPAGRAGSRDNQLVLERGVNLVTLRGTVTSNGQVPEVEVRGWDPAQKKALVSKASARTLSAEVDGVTPVTLAGTFGSPPYVAGMSTMYLQATVDAAASSLADHVAGGFAELEGTARGNSELRAGKAVQLVGVGAPFAGKYVLSSTRHEFSPERGYLTTFVVSNTSERTLYGATSGATKTRTRIGGVVPALVTNVKDPEKQGRVKIQLPWLSDSYESWWARPVFTGGGPERGLVVLPEVGDEVLVAFGQDNVQQPYILGGLYNGKDLPDKAWGEHIDPNTGAVKRRAWTSRTGMSVEFLDGPTEQKVTVSTNNGAQKIALLQTAGKGIEIVSEGPVKITGKQDVEVSTGAGAMTLKGTSIKIEATGSLDLKGATVKVAGQGAAELSASGVTTVKGSMVKIN